MTLGDLMGDKQPETETVGLRRYERMEQLIVDRRGGAGAVSRTRIEPSRSTRDDVDQNARQDRRKRPAHRGIDGVENQVR